MSESGALAPDGGGHKQLWYALSNPTVVSADLKSKSRQIGYICKDLHIRRVKADYKLDETVDRADVETAMRQAKWLFELAK